MASLARAREFVQREARVLEQRLFATLFDTASPRGVARALAGYRNDDGGLGHGLEPDVRSPPSQPLFVAFGLQTLVEADGRDHELAAGCCDYLETVADARGAVPFLLPTVEPYARAAHWQSGPWEPSVHATVWIVGSLRVLGIDHAWVERATALCISELSREPPTEAHAIRDSLRFANLVGDQELWERIAAAIPHASPVRRDPASPDYGLTPLQLAPSPERAHELFSAGELERHLDALEAAQQEDGGWPISWNPPSDASRLEWRGRWTVEALSTLRAYGRCS